MRTAVHYVVNCRWLLYVIDVYTHTCCVVWSSYSVVSIIQKSQNACYEAGPSCNMIMIIHLLAHFNFSNVCYSVVCLQHVLYLVGVLSIAIDERQKYVFFYTVFVVLSCGLYQCVCSAALCACFTDMLLCFCCYSAAVCICCMV